MLNSSGESGHLCLVPDVRGNAFHFSLLRVMLAVCLSYIAFNCKVISFQLIKINEKNINKNSKIKEIEENNRMGKTRDLFKKIRDTKETFHGKMGTIKDKMLCT